MFLKVLRSFFLIINWRTLLAVASSVISSYVCIHLDIKVEFPFYLISIAIVFPIVFSIDSAYKRREHALYFYGDSKVLRSRSTLEFATGSTTKITGRKHKYLKSALINSSHISLRCSCYLP